MNHIQNALLQQPQNIPHYTSYPPADNCRPESTWPQPGQHSVQAAINRPLSFEITREVAKALRSAQVTSVNIDALYGLPLQTLERLKKTIAQVLSLELDRIALFGYAHMPWLKHH